MTSDDIAPLVKSLDLPAKVRLLTGASAFTLAPEPAIGLGEMRFSDGPTGVRGLKFSGGRVVSLFPNATLLASAWSPEVAYEVGRLLAEEASAQEIHVVLGPTINLHRTALGGRLFEAYSEDPLLTGKLAAAYVRGLQDSGIAACLKHLVANESETDRNTVDSVVDEATLRELYLLPFEIAVAESDAWSIMAAYNDVNGVAATEQHHVINEILKGEWDYRGLVMSDWFATKTAAPAANGGLDLVMPGPDGPWGAALVDAVHSGLVDESVIDDHLSRLLVLAQRVGALGAARSWPSSLPAPDSPVRVEQLTRLAASGMTVLKNDGDVLPLGRDASVALIGRHAVETIDMGGGSAQVNPPYQVSVATGLTALLGDRVTVVDGVDVRTRPVPARDGFLVAPSNGQAGIDVSLFDAAGELLEQRFCAQSRTMIGMDDDLPAAVATARLVGRVTVDGEVSLGVLGVGDWSVAAGDPPSPLPAGASPSPLAGDSPTPPSAGDSPSPLSGGGSPSPLSGGGSPTSLPASGSPTPPSAGGSPTPPSAGDSPTSFSLRASGGGFGEEVLAPPLRTDAYTVAAGTTFSATVTMTTPMGLFGLIGNKVTRSTVDVIDDAVRAAATADVAVVVVGLTEEQETESVDKSTLSLPGAQNALVEAVAGAARHTVVVVNAATPVLMPWLPRVDAVLWAGLPGQEGGHAVAAALLGDIEPAGRLVTTFPAADEAAPAWSVTPVDGKLPYTEGTFIGYRGHFAGRAPAPAFWLGHGLGYGKWEYTDVRLITGDSPTITATVTNVGTRTSREVVQVYLRPVEADEPTRLVGWATVTVAPGESARVTVETDARLWRKWDAAASTWTHLADGGELLVARGLGDIRATLT